MERRAIQLGLRGEAIAQYAKEWIISIEDVSNFVAEQRQNATPARYDALLLPKEEIYAQPR